MEHDHRRLLSDCQTQDGALRSHDLPITLSPLVSTASRRQNNTTHSRTPSKKEVHIPELSWMKVWRQEALACIGVIVALTAIVVTLILVDGRPLPKIGYGLSINTVIAVFAALLKIMAAFILAEGLGQMKWSWFSRPRRLEDFVAYDDASRGPIGAIILLLHLRLRSSVASIGAFLTIAAILVDPLSQQLIRLYDCQLEVPNMAAIIPRTNNFEERGGHIGAATNRMTNGFVGSLAAGQFSTSPPQVPFTCSSNFTFDCEYSSVGYCSSCSDVSARLRFSGANLTKIGVYDTVRVTLDSATPQAPPVLTFEAGGFGNGVRYSMKYGSNGYNSVLSMAWYEGPEPSGGGPSGKAYECSLSPCAQNFRAVVENGRLMEHSTGSSSSWGYPGEDLRYNSMVDLSCVNSSVKVDLVDLGYDLSKNDRWLAYNTSYNPYNSNDMVSWATQIYLNTTQPDIALSKGLLEGTYSNWTLSNRGMRVVPKECVFQIHSFIDTSLDSIYFPSYFDGNLSDNYYNQGEQGPLIPTSFYSAGADNDTNCWPRWSKSNDAKHNRFNDHLHALAW